MKRTILDVFEDHLGHIKFDKEFYVAVSRFRTGWATKNNDNIEFLGSNLLGSNPIRFTALDEETLFLDILEVDKNELKKDLHSIKGIDPSRAVTSNVFYLTMTYLMHGFTVSKHIGKDRDNAVREVYYIFAYRAMSSLISHYFKYDVERSIAVAVNEQLSNKFLIKKLGTWQKVFEYRSDAVIQPKGLHAKRVYTYTTDDAVRIVMDLQGRIRETVKNIYLVLIDVNENNNKVKVTSLDKTDIDGESVISDIVDRPDMYIIYIKDIVYKYNDFIKDDLMHVIANILNMPNTKDLYETLTYISENSMRDIKGTGFLIEASIDIPIEYLSKQQILSNYQSDINQILIMLKNYYTGSRVDNKDMDKVKKMLKKIYMHATGKKNKTAVSNIRVGVMLYIILRALAKNSYT